MIAYNVIGHDAIGHLKVGTGNWVGLYDAENRLALHGLEILFIINVMVECHDFFFKQSIKNNLKKFYRSTYP